MIEGEIHQGEILGQPLLDFGADGNTVIVVQKDGGIGEVDPIVNEGGAYGIVTDRGYDVYPILEAGKSTHLEVVSFILVREHLASQKRRVFPILQIVHFQSTVDFKIRLFPLVSNIVLVDKRTVKKLVMAVKSKDTVVANHGSVVVDVAIVDIASVKRCA